MSADVCGEEVVGVGYPAEGTAEGGECVGDATDVSCAIVENIDCGHGTH